MASSSQSVAPCSAPCSSTATSSRRNFPVRSAPSSTDRHLPPQRAHPLRKPLRIAILSRVKSWQLRLRRIVKVLLFVGAGVIVLALAAAAYLFWPRSYARTYLDAPATTEAAAP